MDIILIQKFVSNNQSNNIKEGFSIKNITGVPNKVATLIISFIAAYLCWNVNQDTNIIIKIIYCLFAAIFSGIYLIYFYFVHFREMQNNRNEFNFI